MKLEETGKKKKKKRGGRVLTPPRHPTTDPNSWHEKLIVVATTKRFVFFMVDVGAREDGVMARPIRGQLEGVSNFN